ncbi:(2Fe-2S) ferredoxin domain-containing protein [cf. Phormidesmis sp. LEGE 11477]|uniref:(2Fe-2S) ferredoxin domain-containing protein n=1 Tax=cf. Phormidesmis sp. LEGE 11477 TaxID=1828680 RepID=UPI00187EDB04|nr:(2Fe-2S) ferredoxin domain-containing protein [cf. Phormidesmis sp. LEGE 11477]MBE9060821.1 (2Fe-2S) ferredoxin domain-containing protein [cf. Phormidesmis sp. LEGE 11477]
MAASKKTRFSWVGQFLAFVPGKKSPYQSAFVQVVAAEKGAPVNKTKSYQIRLDKDIREAASDSIEAQDWIKIAGRGKPDKKTGKIVWKADTIKKISLRKVAKIKEKVETRSQSAPSKSLASAKAKPARVLVCQKSSCRKKGSQKVSAAIEDAIAKAEAAENVIVKSTGCLKCCKTGPTVVVLPASSSKKASKETHRKVTPKSAKKIVASLL